MSAVVADTHIAIWYLATPDKLSPNALAALYLGLPLVTRDLRMRSADITTIW